MKYLGPKKQTTTITAINAVVLDDSPTSILSSAINCEEYKEFLLEVDVAVTLAPTTVQFKVFFSDDDTTYYQYMKDFWGLLLYEDSAGAKTEALPGKIMGKYMKVQAVGVGTDAANKFTITAKAVMIRE